MAQITNVTSESLQAKIRQLLPSQQGFGEDLQAQNVIVPIIDLTETAEGSSVRADLQTAIAFGSNTFFESINVSNDIVTTTGFYRVFGTTSVFTTSSLVRSTRFVIANGGVAKIIWQFKLDAATGSFFNTESFDFVVFLRAGDVLRAISSSTDSYIGGSTRQIADVNGVLVNPSGFTPQ